MKKQLIILLFLVSVSLKAMHPKFYSSSKVRPAKYKHYNKADSLHGFDVQKYVITLSIEDEAEYIEGNVEAIVVAEEVLNQIEYELEDLNVTEVEVNNETADFSYNGDVITIFFDEIQSGEEFQTRVYYNGYPSTSDDVYHIGMIFSSNYVFTLSDPSGCRWWWPAYDYPWDKAIVDFHVTMRDDWLVACNGIRESIEDNNNGTKTHHWIGENPMSTYLPCISAANFEEINQSYDDIPIQNFVVSSQYDDAVEDFENLPYMMEVYEEKYGEYPFEKYGNAVVPMVTYGAMEHQTMTTLGEYIITGNHTYETIIAHELSHHWFGNCLTPLTWKDVWLSESFATYSEAVYTEEWQGYESMCDYVENSYHNYYINWSNSYGSRVIYDPPYNEYFAPPVYEKGASVLHMLRLRVGDEIFWQILQAYFQTYKNGNVVTDEFIEVCEDISGENLEQFFHQWIFQPGLPELEYAYFLDEDNEQIKTYFKTSCDDGTEFYMKIPVNIDYQDNTETFLVDAYPDTPAENINYISQSINTIMIDPDNWILNKGMDNKRIQINNAYSGDENIIIYWEDFWDEVSIEGYNIYRSESLDGEYLKINSEIITENFYTDTNLENNTTFYYKVASVQEDGFISQKSTAYEATPLDFPMNQGVLIIDETLDSNGSPGNPTDEMVDDFYQSVIPESVEMYDYNEHGELSLELLTHYAVVIWHDDDMSQHYINDNLMILGSYLAGNGNLIISGWKTADLISDYFVRDFLNIELSELVMTFECVGSNSDIYANLEVDADKLPPAFNGYLPFVTIFPDGDNGIYSYDGVEGSDYNGEICGISNLDANMDYSFTLLGFPLYYMEENGVSEFMSSILENIDESSSDSDIVQTDFSVDCYPNPFYFNHIRNNNLSFTITSQHNSYGKLEIFNMKGQKVKTIYSGKIKSGKNTILWDTKDEYGKELAAGVYFYKFTAEKNNYIDKFIILK